MFREQVYFIGLRYRHHAEHSGYEGFGRYVGSALAPPVNFRWPLGTWGYLCNGLFCRILRHPWYSIGAHLTEWAALGKMARSRGRLYHVLYGDTDLWLLRRAHRWTGNRLIATFHQPVEQIKELGMIQRTARYLDAAVLVSEAQRSYFESFLPSECVYVVPHGVDTEFFAPPDVRNDQPVCVTVGAHLRDFKTLRDAIRLVWTAKPEARFIAIGTRSDSKYRFPELKDRRIEFLDGVSDQVLRQAHQSSRVAVFSLQAATANNSVLEAMASGLPIVATDVGGVREYVDPEMGVLCPPKDPRALADGILKVLNDPETTDKMARQSRAGALRLDYRIIAEKMTEIYARILSTF